MRMQKDSAVDRIHQSKAKKTLTYGAKSCIAEGIAAGSGQGEDEGNDGGANHVWVLFGVCGLEL